jgi:hypothetical protein
MRARTGRVAVVIFSSISVCGCTSGPSWNGLSWWHKKPDTTAVADAPKYNPANPALPSAAQNPNNSLTNIARPNAAMAAAAANPAAAPGMTGYSAAPAAYQNTVYPTTPYQQAKLPPAAGGNAAGSSAASPSANPGANAWASSGANPWTGGAQIPGPAVGYSANSAMPGRYAPGAAGATPGYNATTGGAAASNTMPQNYAGGNQSTAMAAAPPYGSQAAMAAAPGYIGSAAPASNSQPQAGFYNPTYDGGGSATRYASGTAIPSAAASTGMTAAAAQAPSSSIPSNSMPNISAPDYRTADARSSMTNGAGPMANADAGVNNTPVGDRYSGFNGAATVAAAPAAAPASAAPATDRYSVPAAAPTATPSGMPAAGDRYAQPTGGIQPAASGSDQGNSSYQPGVMANPVGNTGYNLPDGASAAAGVGNAAMSGLPARSNSEYRPGGTSNYISPTGSPVQPSSNGAQPDSHSQNAVSPAGYQSAAMSNGQSVSGVSLASAAAPVTSNGDVYGAYQGGGYRATTSNNNSSSFNASPSEPAYGAPNPVAATPALLPAQPAW